MNGGDLPVVGAAIGCCSSPVKELFAKDDEEQEQFVNTGLQKWEKGREQWLTKDNSAAPKVIMGSNGNGNDGGNGSGSGNVNNNGNNNNNGMGKISNGNGKRGRGAVDLNVDEIIDCIVSNRWRSALKGGKDKAVFPQAVPLPQMIDILTDLWEAEGLDV